MRKIKTYQQFSESLILNEEEGIGKWIAGAALLGNLVLSSPDVHAAEKGKPEITSTITKTGNEDPSQLLKKLPDTFETNGDFNESLASKSAQKTVHNLIADATKGLKNYSISLSGMDPNDFYDMKMFKSEDGKFKVVGIKRDEIRKDVDKSKWNKLLGQDEDDSDVQKNTPKKRFNDLKSKFSSKVQDWTQKVKERTAEEKQKIQDKLKSSF